MREFFSPTGTMHCDENGVPFCFEAWDAISQYIYTGLQGGAIMHGWMNDDKAKAIHFFEEYDKMLAAFEKYRPAQKKILEKLNSAMK